MHPLTSVVQLATADATLNVGLFLKDAFLALNVASFLFMVLNGSVADVLSLDVPYRLLAAPLPSAWLSHAVRLMASEGGGGMGAVLVAAALAMLWCVGAFLLFRGGVARLCGSGAFESLGL